MKSVTPDSNLTKKESQIKDMDTQRRPEVCLHEDASKYNISNQVSSYSKNE